MSLEVMTVAPALDRFPFAGQTRLPQAKKLSDKQLMLLWACFKSWINRPRQPRHERKDSQLNRFRFFDRKRDNADVIMGLESV